MDRLLAAPRGRLRGRTRPCASAAANKTPLFGNDDDRADDIMQRVYDSLFAAIDGRPNTKGGGYHLNMLSTTCHVYFGTMLGATPDGRLAGTCPTRTAPRPPTAPTATARRR